MCLEVRMHRTVGRVIEMVSDGVVCYTELLSLPSPPLHTSPLGSPPLPSVPPPLPSPYFASDCTDLKVWCEGAVSGAGV